MKIDKIETGPSVSAACYDAEWIRSAWGKGGVEAFLSNLGRNIRPRVQVALSLRPIRPGMKVLDIGCGRGEVVIYAAKQGAEAHGIDYSQEVIAVGRDAVSHLPPHEQERIHLHNEDVKDIPFGEETFDIIYLLDIVEHLYDWELDVLFTRICRLLKPDGVIVLHTLPNRWVYDITYKAARTLLPFWARDPRGEHEKMIHVNEQTVLSVHSLLKRHGLASRVCLTEELGRQALWYRDEHFGDRRDRIYRWLRKPPIRGLLTAVSYLPIKFLVLNDIYAVAARSEDALPKVPFRGCMWEKALIRLAAWQRDRRRFRT